MSKNVIRFILILIFSSIVTLKSEVNDWISPNLQKEVLTLEELNQGISGIRYERECSLDLFKKSKSKKLSSEESFNRCAIDLCGPPALNPSAWIMDSNFSKSITPFALKRTEKLVPLIDKMFEISTKRKNELVAEIKKLTASPEEKLDKLGPDDRATIFKLFFERFMTTVIDKNAPLFERIQVKIKSPPDASIEMLVALKHYAEKLKNTMNRNSYYVEFQQVYKESDFLPILRSIIDDLKKTSNTSDLNEILAIEKQVFVEKKYVPLDFHRHFNRLKMLGKNNSSITNNVYSDVDCEAPECKMVLVDFLKSPHLKSSLENQEKLLNDPTLKKQLVNQCRAKVIAKSIRMTDAKKVQALFKQAIESVKKNLLPIYSRHSRSLLDDYLNKNLSASHKDFRRARNSDNPFTDFEDSAKQFLSFNASVVKFSNRDLSFDKILEIDLTDDQVNPHAEVEPCASSISNAWDAFYPTKTKEQLVSQEEKDYLKNFGANDIVFVSDFSCEHNRHGLSNVVHEIGHAINAVFTNLKLSTESKAKFDKTRACITSIYPKNPMSRTIGSVPGDKLSTEEDMADQMALFVLPKDKVITSCALLKPAIHNNSYQELSFIDESFEDPHSTSFSRVLFEAQSKNIKLPKSCSDLMASEKAPIEFKQCF